jgi:hypothetical protein
VARNVIECAKHNFQDICTKEMVHFLHNFLYEHIIIRLFVAIATIERIQRKIKDDEVEDGGGEVVAQLVIFDLFVYV